MDADADRTLKRRFIENKKTTNQLLYTASHTRTHTHTHTHTHSRMLSAVVMRSEVKLPSGGQDQSQSD